MQNLFQMCVGKTSTSISSLLRSCLFAFFILVFAPLQSFSLESEKSSTKEGLPMFYWKEDKFFNFGDHLSRILVERIVNGSMRCYTKKNKDQEKKLLAVGSILYFANDGDVVWGSGVNGKTFDKKYYGFKKLDVRAVRGPITRQFLMENFNIDVPEVYGDPALLFPYFFPEFKRKKKPSLEYLIVPHYTDAQYFPKSEYKNVIYTMEPWDKIIDKILDTKFVVSSSLHAIVIAEAFGIPARVLRITDSPHNNILKYQDYYLGTNRPSFQYATSVEQALKMGGEPPIRCDLKKLYEAFPFEFWPNRQFKHPDFGVNYESQFD